MRTDLHGPLSAYAARLHATAGDRHHVASPLGAWLLLAVAATTADQATAEGAAAELAQALGTDLPSAAEVARTLLDAPHPLVGSATALWHRPGQGDGGPAAWRAGLPSTTEVGVLPDQAGLDAWAREHTLGLIETFPLRVGPDVVLALASALATRVSWATPFDVADARALGAGSPWAGRLRQALRSPSQGHRCAIVSTAQAGDVIVHAAPAQTTDGAGLVVLSVAAAPQVPPAEVLAVAYDLSAGAADGAQPAGSRSLFDLPLGEAPLWTLTEERVRTRARDGREERHSAVLPCWSARSDHDLTAPALGFPAVAATLATAMALPVERFEARQTAVARFDRYGFEAAAVTAMFGLTSLPPEGVARTAELRFGHPYAVVAVATDARGGGATGPWHGVPVFSAWVAEPEEVSEA
ncbi:hypothetical protein AB0C06_24745 [Micromonospora inaquosa]|uniref:Proteinase inhibitor I4 serpin n=1 Tax=Micromonospora inaquosa TaxID=2203716 RepID=A0A3N9VZX1_9ACTN|nr:hypothetical protein [Micromonospora inaquosa]RQW93965.1 hypothetical protein DLJ59_35285 [Micromonospora inaquosa]